VVSRGGAQPGRADAGCAARHRPRGARLPRRATAASVETSPALRAAQAARLAAADPTWLDRLADLPDGPALGDRQRVLRRPAIRQWQRGTGGWHERLIGWDDAAGRLRWELSARSDPGLALIPPAVRGAAEGSIAEASPAGLSHAAMLAVAWRNRAAPR